MGRKKRITVLLDGRRQVMCTVPKVLWEVFEEQAKRWGVRPEQSLAILMDRLGSMFDDGKAFVLGPEYANVHSVLVATDRVTMNGLPPIEAGKLHRSTRTKSGFTGVYVNGEGFRAMARSEDGSGAQRSLGTFPNAELAAWARYLHYKKFKLVYGAAESILEKDDGEIQLYRKELTNRLGRPPTDRELIRELNASYLTSNRELIPLDDDDETVS